MEKIKGSSNIAGVDYKGTTLTIQFHSGATWSYHDVPPHVHRELMNAESKGGYFGSYIRNNYKGKKHEA